MELDVSIIISVSCEALASLGLKILKRKLWLVYIFSKVKVRQKQIIYILLK